jgi:Xaa-Pro aminopeptidase
MVATAHAQPAPDPFQPRISTFRDALTDKNLTAAIVSPPPHVRYLSGIVSAWSPAFLLIDADIVTAIVPASAGIVAPPGITLAPYADGSIHEPAVPRHAALTELGRILAAREIPLDRLGVEREDLSLADSTVLPDIRPAADIGPLLARQRMRKDHSEIDRIRTNLAILAAAFDAARETIRPGVTELAVWSAMHAAMMARAGAPFPLEGNFASGPRTLEDEPQPTSRRLEPGDVVFADLYPLIDGYCADLTRTFIVGQPTPAQRARHAILEQALAAGVEALKPGALASDVDRAVRSTIAAALDGYAMPHHAGHALGLVAQESPMLIPADDTIIEPGMVIAIEPGAYLPDTGGMRLEGNYLVTETGCLPLSSYPLELFGCE